MNIQHPPPLAIDALVAALVYSNQLARTLVSCVGSSDKVSQPTEKKEDEKTEEIKINENLEVMRIMNK